MITAAPLPSCAVPLVIFFAPPPNFFRFLYGYFFAFFCPLFAVLLQFFMAFGYVRLSQTITFGYIRRLGDNRWLCRGIGFITVGYGRRRRLPPFIARGKGACPLSAFCARVHGAIYSPLTPSLYGLIIAISCNIIRLYNYYIVSYTPLPLIIIL